MSDLNAAFRKISACDISMTFTHMLLPGERLGIFDEAVTNWRLDAQLMSPILTLNRDTAGPLGFGGSALGNLYAPVADDTAFAATVKAVELGVRYFDTAPHYGFGASEKRLGAALRVFDPAEKMLVSTKVGRKLVARAGVDLTHLRQGFVSPEPFESAFDYSYDSVMRTFEASLQRLQRMRIDVLYVHDLGRFTHGDDHPARFAEFMDGGYKAMRELQSSGAVGAIGLGVNETEVCVAALAYADFDVVLLAGRYTLLEQDPIDTFLPLCERRGIPVIVGGPYNSGILATGVRKDVTAHYNYSAAPPDVVARVAAIETICDNHQVPLAAAALQFPLAHPQVLNVVAGMATPSQVQQALDHLRLPVPQQLWADLKTAGLIRADAPVPPNNLTVPTRAEAITQ
jgi:D-threo-aldose 1-dehydrogenase